MRSPCSLDVRLDMDVEFGITKTEPNKSGLHSHGDKCKMRWY
jgi:hypothetical protein